MNHRFAVGVLVLAAACGVADTSDRPMEPSSTPPSTNTEVGDCADVVEVEVVAEADDAYRFDVTVRSSDTGWDKYADRWEIRAPDGATVAVRELTHPHVEEQPFTRSLSGVALPLDMEHVLVTARDSVEGFCGVSVIVDIPR